MIKRSFCLWRYYRKIRNALPCSAAHKNEIISNLNSNINAYIESNPEADFKEITERFGTAKTIIDSCIAELSSKEIAKRLNTAKKITAAILAAALIIVLVFGICMAVQVKNSGDKEIEEHIISVIPPESG